MVAAKPEAQETQGEANTSTGSADRNRAASGLAADPADTATGEHSPSRSQLSRSVSCDDAANGVVGNASSVNCQHFTTGADSTTSYSHLHQWHYTGAARTHSG